MNIAVPNQAFLCGVQAHNISVQPAPAGSLVAALSGWLDKGLNKLIGGSELPSSGPAALAEAERRAASEPGSPRGVCARTWFRVEVPAMLGFCVAGDLCSSRRPSGAPRLAGVPARGASTNLPVGWY